MRAHADEFQHGITQGGFYGFKGPLPDPPVFLIEGFPTVEGVPGDFIGLTDPLYRFEMEEMLRKNTEDKKQAVLLIRNDGIREDGMGGVT